MFLHKIDEDLSLKLPEEKDAATLFTLTDNSRLTLREWLPWVDGTKTLEDTKSFINFGRKGFSENKSLTALILFKEEIAGTAGFNELDHTNNVAKIGYWLGAEFQGKGIMTRTVTALVEYAISEMEMNRVEIRAAEENEKSRAIPERLGFTEEGRIRQGEWLYDHYVDHIVYGMLASEWKEQK
ncbi:GNAT family N-acetyltransferase [Halobacillus litoralis]|uniref:RimJ/RimL family protein N-acetyltransferase n=1 Tax=Halobacillus litoralis TaxID=45668 RepID=A0A410MI66_9BACI|nr:GNAT family protein [Halobacillus litoralis]QAS54356.1 RimJ/RimL family protein N-acetyltransferase [Halobacillus litoralis]